MLRTRTVERLLHAADRREQLLLQVIDKLNDRLAFSYDKPWTLPPPTPDMLEPDDDDDDVAIEEILTGNPVF